MNTLEYARYYVEKLGWSVIPLKPHGKTPALPSWKEFQNRKPTSDELLKWFDNGSQNNLGVVTGTISGLEVLDFDSEEAVNFAEENGLLQGPLVRTGRGFHEYFKNTEGARNFQQRPDMPHIDRRAEGGYVVAPPSIHPSGKFYAWIEGKGLDDVPLEELPEVILAKVSEDKGPLAKLYEGVKEGQRNDTLARLVGSWARDGLPYEDCLESARTWNIKNDPPLPDQELQKTVASICQREVTKVTIVTDEFTALGEDEQKMPVCDFPLDVFTNPMQQIVMNFSNALQVSPEVVACCQLPIIAAAIGNTIRVSPKPGWTEPLFVWQVIIAPTGYGKTPVINCLVKPIEQMQGVLFKEFHGIDVDPLPHRAKTLYISDTTVEALALAFQDNPRGVLIKTDELSGWIMGLDQYKAKGNDRPHYLELFTCDPWNINRVSQQMFVPNTGASIIGGIQPKVMKKVFGSESFEDGLLPRFLFFYAEEEPAKFVRQGIREEDFYYWSRLLNYCYNIALPIGEDGFVISKILELDEEALETFEAFYNHYHAVKAFLSELARAFVPKLIGYSLRFAGILHVLQHFDEITEVRERIDQGTMDKAIRITKFYAGQITNVVELYQKPVAEDQGKLQKALINLVGEVKSGRLPISRITEMYNEGLGLNLRLTPKKTGSMLRRWGLRTEKSTGNQSFLIWEEGKLQPIIMRKI
jgi:hypothetical protein